MTKKALPRLAALLDHVIDIKDFQTPLTLKEVLASS